jgi:hypothetical protein
VSAKIYSIWGIAFYSKIASTALPLPPEMPRRCLTMPSPLNLFFTVARILPLRTSADNEIYIFSAKTVNKMRRSAKTIERVCKRSSASASKRVVISRDRF